MRIIEFFLKKLSKFLESCFLWILCGIGFFVRLWYARADPFLHDWDERFHALVARNMMDDPFVPMLKARPYSTLELYEWCCSHIWLHKQPLFMWQMALSMKLFGVSELSMRLPSVIMGTLMIPVLYRLAFLLSSNKTIALLAAALLCFSHFHLIMIAGIKGMDHNDVALGFYVLASIWAYAEYKRSARWYWVILIGLFAGCAVLNKWLLGLTVFLGWGIGILSVIRREGIFREIKHFALALLTCCVVFVPWQLYILHNWPDIANHEYEFNRRHITEALEGHVGTVWYYLERFQIFFGDYLWIFVFIGIIISILKTDLNKPLRSSFLGIVIFVFCFFSFIVRTKAEAHFFFIVPLLMVFLAIGIYETYHKINHRAALIPSFLLIAWISYNPVEVRAYFADNKAERDRKIHNTEIYKKLGNILPKDVKLVINTNGLEDVELMFYHNEVTANHWWISEQDLAKLEKQKVRIAAFKDHGPYISPDFVRNYPYLYIIDQELR